MDQWPKCRLWLCLFALNITALCQEYGFVRVAGGNTPRPDGRGAFNLNVLGRPAIEGTSIVFTTVQANSSLWSYDLLTSEFVKLADTTTAAPEGTGNFTDFATLDSKPLLSDGVVVFLAYDSKTARPNQGLYSVPVKGGDIKRIANYNSRSPQGVAFAELDASFRQPFGGFSVHNGKAAFTVTLTDGNPGIYTADLDGGALTLIADRNTRIPLSPILDVRIWQNPWIRNGQLIFYGQTIMDPSTGFNAIYTAPATGGRPQEVFTSARRLPGNPNPNSHTRIRIPTLQMDDDRIAFVADDPTIGGMPDGGNRRFRGLYTLPRNGAGIPERIADIHSELPGMGPLWATSFASYSLHSGKILFRVAGGPKEGFPAGEQALMLWKDGQISRLIGTGDMLDGRVVRQVFDVSPQALSGDRFTFLVDFIQSPGLAIYAAVPLSETTTHAVANSASLRQDMVSPGGLVTVSGSGFGPEDEQKVDLSAADTIPTVLGGLRVLFNGIPAPVLGASPGQASVIAPFALDGASSVDVVVQFKDSIAAPFRATVVPADPALFAADNSGTGQGLILNEDGATNSPESPAMPGSKVVLYGAGFGQTNPPSIDGTFNSSSNPPRLRTTATVTIDALPAQVLYQGPAHGMPAGMVQFDVRIPAAAESGDRPVKITFGNASTQDGITVNVR